MLVPCSSTEYRTLVRIICEELMWIVSDFVVAGPILLLVFMTVVTTTKYTKHYTSGT